MQTNNGKLQQFLAALTVSLLSISSGIGCGWPSPTIPQLLSNNTPVGDAPMSASEVSWIAGLYPLGGFLIIPFCGILTESVGRRNFALFNALPYVVSWLIIIFARNYIYIYAARLACGMAAAMTVFIVPMYTSEIASEDIRGVLGNLLSLFGNIGVLLVFVGGAFLSYRLLAIFAITIPIVFALVVSFLPESPVYLVRKNREVEARKSLMFYRNKNLTFVDQELARLQQQSRDANSAAKKIRLRDFLSDRATRRGLIISIGLLSAQQLSGNFAMISYAEPILQRAGSPIPAEMAPIISGVIQVIGEYTSTMLIDRTGRRPLVLISCVGMAASHAVVGGFFYLEQRKYDVSAFSWLPVVALSTYTITYVLGMSGVPYVVVSEVFRSDIASFASTLCFVLYWAIMLASVKMFDLAMRHLGAAGCFFMLASFCAASLAFVYMMMPETKGRKREDIVDELAGGGAFPRGRDQKARVNGTREQSC